MPAGSSVTYTATCAIDPAASGFLSNTATISSVITDPAMGDEAATEVTELILPEIEIPALGDFGLLFLMLAVGMLGILRLRSSADI